MVERPAGEDLRRSDDGAVEAGQGTDSDHEAVLAARLARLGESLKAHPAAVEAAEPKARSSGTAQAMKVASEFVAGVVVGVALGWAFDELLGTRPWGLIVFLLLGFAAGVLNVLRAEGKVAESGAGLRAAAKKSVSESDPSD